MASNPLEALPASPAADINSQPPTGSPASAVGSVAAPPTLPTQPDSSPGNAPSPPTSGLSDNATGLGDTSSSNTSSNATSLGDTNSNNTSSTGQVEPPPVTSNPVETAGAITATPNSLPLPAASSNPGSNRDLTPQDLFDEKYYLAQYPEVKTAVSSGAVPTAYQHFIKYGQFENRSPCAQFNPKLYLSLNLDIKASLQTGAVGSAFEHFYRFGVKEKRPTGLSEGGNSHKITLGLRSLVSVVGSTLLGGTIAPRAKVDPLTGSPTLNGAIIDQDKPAFTPDPSAKYRQFSVNTQPFRLTLQLGGEILPTADSLLRLAPSSFPGGILGSSFGHSGVASADRSRWAAPWGNGVDLALPSGLPWGLASGGISAKPTQLRGFDAEPC